MHVAGGILEDEAADVAVAVQQVVADHALGDLHAGQTLGVDPDAVVAIGVQDLHVGGEGPAAQLGAVGIDLAGEGGRGEIFHLHAVFGGHRLDQGAGADAGAVGGVGVGAAVGGQDGDGGGGVVVAVLVGVLLGHVGDHQTAHAAAGSLAGGHGGGHLAVPAQEEGHRVAHGKGAQVAEGVGGGGGLDGVGLAGDRHRSGGGGGGDGLDGAGDLIGVDPQGVEVLGPVDHVVVHQGGGGGDHAVPGHPGGGEVKGNLVPPAGLAHHHGAVHGAVEEGQGVHLTVGGEAVAQHGGEVGLPGGAGGGGEQVVEEVHGVLALHGVVLADGDALVQIQRLIHGHLPGGEGAGEVLVGVAQQPQGHDHALGQGDGVGGAEGAVQVAGDVAGGHGGLHIGGGPVGGGHVGVGGDVGHVPHADGGGGHEHLYKFGPGHRGGEVQIAVFVAGHDIQGGEDLGGLLPAGEGQGGGDQGQGEGRRQKGGEDSFLHHCSLLFSRSAGRRWG